MYEFYSKQNCNEKLIFLAVEFRHHIFWFSVHGNSFDIKIKNVLGAEFIKILECMKYKIKITNDQIIILFLKYPINNLSYIIKVCIKCQWNTRLKKNIKSSKLQEFWLNRLFFYFWYFFMVYSLIIFMKCISKITLFVLYGYFWFCYI